MICQSIPPRQTINKHKGSLTDEFNFVPHIKHSLEQALEFIEDDELVEVTPESIRLRKKGIVRT